MQPLTKREQNTSFSEKVNCLKIKELSQLGQITIVLVKNKYDPNHVVWKRMMEDRHYLRSGRLFGRQLRYLVGSSEQGWIGGLGFSSASWRLKERDERITWSGSDGEPDLDRIVCNSRFLIMPEFGACFVCFATACKSNGRLVIASLCLSGFASRTKRFHQL